MSEKTITTEDIANLRLDESIRSELYSLKDSAETAGALKHLLNSEGWDVLKEAILDDAQTAIMSVISSWKNGETIALDRNIARLEQLLTIYTTVQGSGADEKEANELLANRTKEILGMMG